MAKMENKYIEIIETPHSGKTKGFDVRNKRNGYTIGDIGWYISWRQYCFSPFEDMVFNSDCLELVTEFLKNINTEHRTSWNQKQTES